MIINLNKSEIKKLNIINQICKNFRKDSIYNFGNKLIGECFSTLTDEINEDMPGFFNLNLDLNDPEMSKLITIFNDVCLDGSLMYKILSESNVKKYGCDVDVQDTIIKFKSEDFESEIPYEFDDVMIVKSYSFINFIKNSKCVYTDDITDLAVELFANKETIETIETPITKFYISNKLIKGYSKTDKVIYDIYDIDDKELYLFHIQILKQLVNINCYYVIARF